MIAEDLQGRKLESGSITFDVEPEEYGFFTEGNALTVTGSFSSDSVELADVTVRAYTAFGFASETRVHSDGYFSLGIVGLPPGRTPIIVVVSSPNVTGVRRARELQEESSGHRVPCSLFSVNNEACPPSLDLELTWDGPTSDVDLHVYEENGDGAHVYYANDTGNYGYLNVDDTDGLGPEHYYANILDEPQTFKTDVHMFEYNNDSIVNWDLVANIEGVTVDTWHGSFTEGVSSDWSNQYSITLDTSICMKCLTPPESRARRLSGTCCPPKRYKDEDTLWCSWFGDCGDELTSYKIWSDLNAQTNPSAAQVRGLAMLVFGHRTEIPYYNRALFDLGMGNIVSRGNCLKDMWGFLLQVYCKNEALESALQGIYEANSIISLLQKLQGTSTASNSAEYYAAITDSLYADVSGEILQEATKTLKSYTVDRAFLANFAIGVGDC
jgi:hypothetical protein